MKRRLVTIFAGALVVGLTACGGSSGPELSTNQRRDLMSRVQNVRTALASYNPDAARAELSTLRAQVSELQRRQRISDEQAAAILSAAAAVEADLQLAPTTTTTTTTTTPTVPEDDHGKGKGKGNKSDEGEDGGED